MIILYAIIIISFSAYSVFESITLFARISGAIAGKNAIAASYVLIINTIKRIFIFIYPPLLGIMVMRGEANEMLLVIILSYAGATVAMISVFVFKFRIMSVLYGAISRFALGGGVIRSIKASDAWNGDYLNIVQEDYKKHVHGKLRPIAGIFVISITIYSLYSSSIFVINSSALAFPEYSPIVLQLSALITGVGTIILSFFLDPIVAREIEGGDKLYQIVFSIFFGSFFGYFVLSPIVFILFYTLIVF